MQNASLLYILTTNIFLGGINLTINIKNIIELNNLKSVFQPIVSTKSKKIIGFEALTRGIHPVTGEIISSDLLFSEAKKQNLLLELDRVCRINSIKKFKVIYDENKNLFLFLNFDVSVLDTSGVLGSDHLFNAATNIGVPPQNIVIEFIENKIHDTAALKTFATNYRNYGFILALDNVGMGSSNLDRLFLIHPDIIKIDKNIIHNIGRSYYKQEIFKSLSSIAKRTGALLIAVGTETESEILSSLELGSDLLQGYFFCKPVEDGFEKTLNNLDYILSIFKEHILLKFKSKNAYEKVYDEIISTLSTALSAVSSDKFKYVIDQHIDHYPLLECIYILNDSGIQITDTIVSSTKLLKSKNYLFHPALSGESHMLKDYFYFLKNTGIIKYLTEPYISLASGNLCITISHSFADNNGEKYVLCVDISPHPLDKNYIAL